MSQRSAATVARIALIVSTATIYLVSMARTVVTNDVTTTALVSWRLAATGTPWFDGTEYANPEGPYPLWIAEAPNGHAAGFRSPGPIAAGVPPYLMARALGLDTFSIVPSSVMAAVLTSVALALFFAALSTFVSTLRALMATLALGLTTPVWSISADSLWTHPVTIVGVAGMAYAAARERWWLVGLFGGVALWGRLHMALVVLVIGLGVAWSRRSSLIAVRVGVPSGLALVLAFVWGKWMYGTWSPAGGYSLTAYATRATSQEHLLDQFVNHAGLWISPDRGILVWTPALLLLAPAVVRQWRHLPDWSRWLAIGGVAYALMQGQLNGFSGGTTFYGYRLTLELLVCLFPAMVLSSHRAGNLAQSLLGPVLGLQFAVISIGAAADGGVLGENTLWTRNSFAYLVAEAPVVGVWAMLITAFGWWIGGRVREREAATARESVAAPRN